MEPRTAQVVDKPIVADKVDSKQEQPGKVTTPSKSPQKSSPSKERSSPSKERSSPSKEKSSPSKEKEHQEPKEVKKMEEKAEVKEERTSTSTLLRIRSSNGPEDKGNNSRPKRKWGSSSNDNQQRSRGITSSQLNNLLPRETTVSTSGDKTEEEGQLNRQTEAMDVSQVELNSDKDSIVSGKQSSVGSTAPAVKRTTSLEDVDKVKNNELSDKRKSSLTEGLNGTASMEKEQSPPRNPPSQVVFVQNLTRPFTLIGLQGLLKKYGQMNTERFWIDKIKSKCLVTFSSIEEAEMARKELHGLRWPDSNPKTLTADFATEEEIEIRKKADEAPPVPPPSVPQEKEVIKKTIENERVTEKKVVRDWDKDKVDREPSPPLKRRRSRSRSPRRDREFEPKKREGKFKLRSRYHVLTHLFKVHDEPMQEMPAGSPAKLLDDLFRKTAATPVIYYLPLTEEDAHRRIEEREQRERQRKEAQAAREEERARMEKRSPPRKVC